MTLNRHIILIATAVFVVVPMRGELEGASDMTKEALVAGDLSVLNSYVVNYSDPDVSPDVYDSKNFDYNPKSMDHLYQLTHFFLDLITRDDALPRSLVQDIQTSPLKLELFLDHWKDFLLQYIGVITLGICGILAAIVIPISGLCFCCCRCAGKCGGYPEHFDKKSDACKRVSLGIVLSVLVIGAMFGVITIFVTNHYANRGFEKLPERIATSTLDASYYLDNTGIRINSLFVTNFNQLEVVLIEILDDSGPILKKSLAEVTQAVAIDDINSIVSSLGDVKKYLRDIKTQIKFIQDHAGQLSLGLEGTKARLLQALRQCSAVESCAKFLTNFDIQADLSVVDEFDALRVPQELDIVLKDIDLLLDDDIEKKVRIGQKQLDFINLSIDESLKDHRSIIKDEIRRFGKNIEDKSAEIQGALNEVHEGIDSFRRDVKKSFAYAVKSIGGVTYYVGVGMSCLVLLILTCYVLGLFHGFCGKRPGNEYGDDCCNRGTGASWIIAGVYLTFLFSFVLLLLATAQFLLGAFLQKWVCQTVKSPNESDVFINIIDVLAQPQLDKEVAKALGNDTHMGPLSQIISNCHLNQSAYEILNLQRIYDVEKLRDWREEFNIEYHLRNINVGNQDLQAIELLSPQARKDLERLAESQISDLNFKTFTELVENKITQIELPSFIRKLRQVKDKLQPSLSRVGAALENEALFLDQMQRLIVSIRIAIRQLKSSVAALESEAKFKKTNMREALVDLMRRTEKATQFIRNEGSQLINQLTNRFFNETVFLVDTYVERVINRTKGSVGKCWPVSEAYNATVNSICVEVVDPFNGFWVSIGICYLFYLLGLAFAVPLVGLYKKSEPYPGPLVEVQVTDQASPYQQQRLSSQQPYPKSSKNKKSGNRSRHRRNPSESLPESAHYRPAYSSRFQDAAPRVYGGSSPSAGNRSDSSSSGPPRYTSNPNIAAAVASAPPPTGGEYERPPPYYYPGPAPSNSRS